MDNSRRDRASRTSPPWTVGEVADMAHVTVRALHHWDAIGLLVPSDRSDAGYRLYSEGDVERLHAVLLFRELGLSLEAIGHALDDPTFDRATALRAHREQLEERVERTASLIRAVDRTLESLERGMNMNTDEMFEGFEDFQGPYAEEAQERWGETHAYRESQRRARGYGRADWSKMQAEQEDVWRRMAELMTSGGSPEGAEAVRLAEEARLLIDRWFYPCSRSMHVGLADMYESDERFTAFYEERAEGLAGFVAQAIRANAERPGAASAEGSQG